MFSTDVGRTHMNTTMSLGGKLRILRWNTKMTLREKSKILNVTMNTVHRWETNLVVPREPMLKKMAEHYGVPLCWLLSDTSSEALTRDAEQNLLEYFRNMPDSSKYKIMGYIERLYLDSNGNDQEEE